MTSALGPKLTYSPQDFWRELEEGISETLAKQLASQGFQETADKTAAFVHDSTNAIAESQMNYHRGLKYGLNMDSCAIFDNKACVADGVSGNGLGSAYAAHLFTSLLIDTLTRSPLPFTHDKEQNKRNVEALFLEIANLASIQSGNYPKRGSATLGFADCRENGTPKSFRALVGALGDVAIYHYSQKERRIRQVNEIHRDLNKDGKPDMADPGGTVYARGFVGKAENISAEEIELTDEDLILLSSDGLYDNLHPDQAEEILAFIITNPFFDKPLEELLRVPRPWESADSEAPPTLGELQAFAENTLSLCEPITSTHAVLRANRYLKLICHSYAELAQKFYLLLMKLKSLEPDDASILQIKKQLKELKEHKGLPGKVDDIVLACLKPTFS